MISRLPAAVLLFLSATCPLLSADGTVAGRITDPRDRPVAGAKIRLSGERETTSDSDGRYALAAVAEGHHEIAAAAPEFPDAVRSFRIGPCDALTLDLQFTKLATQHEAVTITAEVKERDIRNPDPAQRVLVRDEILDANPGRPGAPASIPGIPIETASGGIKAPQYFAPGVAGDHGEPIAQFIQVGNFLLPNNLSANAHGNGYADPNILVPAIIESVQTDGGSFNVREGNHSVDLAATYSLRENAEPFATLTAEYRDVDLSAGWKWLAAQASYGNGFLDAPEHRQQYKVNALKGWDLGAHKLTVLLAGYYGSSRIPGLVPVNVPNLHDTIDPRQHDQTHTGAIVLNDVWHLGSDADLHLSGFFRTYNLALYSNFGDGLIRQSEFRTENGGNGSYVRTFNTRFALMAGTDYFREAPRRDNLDRYGSADPALFGPFEKVTANNITLNFLTSFMAVDGKIQRWLHYNLGWRRDQIGFDNADLLNPANSFHRWQGVNSPKVTIAIAPWETIWLPSVSLSFGQSFFTNDPRIGTGAEQGSLVSRAHAYQMVLSKSVHRTDIRVLLGHITQEASLAKIDADTGLQFNEGPGRNQYITLSARHHFSAGLLQASFSRADARDLSDGTPLAEAPRLIVDVLGTLDRLPFRLHARAEFESVESKPLGDGFVSVPVREFRGAVARDFASGKVQAGVHFQIASGYSGQTTESVALPGEEEPFERVVGVYIPSYATLSFSYRFGKGRL